MMVSGIGKDIIGGQARYFQGDSIEAELVKPVGGNPESTIWWVRFQGETQCRIRQIDGPLAGG